MPQALWNGFLRISLVSCPVTLSPATTDAHRVRLDPINARTGNPVAEQFVDSKTGDVVAAEAIVRGHRLDESRHVIVSDEEMRALAGAPPDILDIDQFVPRDQIPRLYYNASCYIYPKGQLASDTVLALRLAMQRNSRVGIGHITLDGREHAVLIEPHGAGLMVSTLHSLDAIEPAEFTERAASEIPVEMVEIAEAIIGRRSRDFDSDMLRDHTAAALRALIERKAPNVAPPPPASEPPPVSVRPPELEPEPEPAVAADAASEPAQSESLTADALSPSPEPEPEPEPEAVEAAEPATQELGAEVLLHIMGLGDRRYVEPGWAGHPGSRRQVEALSIRPREDLPASAIEFRVFAQEGRATAWVSNGNYAGTRGRGLPLTGFAVRPTAEAQDRVEIVYEGSFFEGGVVGPKRDGEVCASPVADDPLEAVRISIVERTAG